MEIYLSCSVQKKNNFLAIYKSPYQGILDFIPGVLKKNFIYF